MSKKKSRLITGFTEDINSNKFIKPESFDIKLHESIRIMSDWLKLLERDQHKESISSKI